MGFRVGFGGEGLGFRVPGVRVSLRGLRFFRFRLIVGSHRVSGLWGFKGHQVSSEVRECLDATCATLGPYGTRVWGVRFFQGFYPGSVSFLKGADAAT